MTTVRIMVDLETLGTAPGCSILSIGAATFSKVSGVGNPFYTMISRKTCLNAGLKEDPDTLIWWSGQSDEARKVLSDTPATESLGLALSRFHDYVCGFLNMEVLIYGNGADFDPPILAAAFRKCGFDIPWKPYAVRCYRTIKMQHPNIKLIRPPGTHHNALSDAECQAEHAVRLLVKEDARE
jgi:DNA polymerase III epsilon subunit-like protein